MNDTTDNSFHVVVVGGGISGLVAAWRLLELAPEARVKLLEGGDRLGGILHTVHQDGFLIEESADSFITDQPWALDFCRRIGLEDQLIRTRPVQRRAMVVRDGRLCGLPDGFLLMAPGRSWPILTSPVLSLRGKLRLLCEPFVSRRGANAKEESLAEFATRRLGREAYERLVQPLVAGIYSADPTKLSVAATMPRFLEMEQKYGSLAQGARRQAAERRDESQGSGARYGLFVTPRGGVSALVATIARQLPDGVVQLGADVESISKSSDGRWSVRVAGQSEPLRAEAVILATPAPAAGRLLSAVDRELSTDLSCVPYASAAVITLGFHENQLARPLSGFGFVVPAVEKRKILAASFSSVKFDGRAPREHALIRVFVGGAGKGELVELADDELRRIACSELNELIGISGDPSVCRIARWRNAMPQYHVGHRQLVENIEARVARIPGLALAGNAYHGVGIPNCIHQAERAAEQILGVTTPAIHQA